MSVRSIRQALADVVDEVIEFVHAPSMDEFSDISWGIGRLLGALTSRAVVRMPGDGRHYRKIAARMAEYGCVRSKRHKCEESAEV